MSGRLDQSLDSIISSKKKTQRERRVKPRKAGKAVAPVGGISKAVKSNKPTVKAAAKVGPAKSLVSKIVVSGLPHDVNESQIKEYFQKSVGPVKRVSLHYNQNGQSRGIVDIIFIKNDSASKAAKEQNGVLVDGRPMKIEVVMDARNVPAPEPAKSLTDRVAYAKPKPSKSAPLTKDSANPKAQPKSATAAKSTKATNAKDAKKKQPKKARTNRPKPKTAEELDAEMTDYWGTGNNAAGASTVATGAAGVAAAPATAGDDMGMEEIS